MAIDELRRRYIGEKTAEQPLDETAALAKLIAEGFRVEVRDPHGKTFHAKYAVFQGQSDKIVVVNSRGEATGLQG